MPSHIKIFPNALSSSLCREAIALFEGDSRVAPDPQPDYSTRDFIKIPSEPKWAPLCTKLNRQMDRVTLKYFEPRSGLEAVAVPEWSDDGFVMSRYNIGDTCALHVDGQSSDPASNGFRIATLLFFLNSVKRGGETYFPLQKMKIKPEEGTAVMFPVTFTHPHEVLKTFEKRYIIQTWIIDPYLVVNHR